jgi:hypothetical protein
MILTGHSLSVSLVAALLLGPVVPEARENLSAEAAKTLTTAMTARQLDAIATVDPANANHFVAALLIPDSQLLVVEADYPNPTELKGLIDRQQYRDVYAALQQPSTVSSRLFFIDAGCDGLKIDRDTVDVLYEKGNTEIILNGDSKKAKLSESEYQQKAQNAATEFSRVVTLLRDSIAATSAAR